MGNCIARLKAEMQVPPPGIAQNNMVPRRQATQAAGIPNANIRRKPQEFDGNGAPLRRETASGIPGLTYDQAGRPVWRDPALKWNGDEVIEAEHFEGKKLE